MSVADALADTQGRELPFAFNRKETKDDGEGGTIVGRRLQGRVLTVTAELASMQAYRDRYGV